MNRFKDELRSEKYNNELIKKVKDEMPTFRDMEDTSYIFKMLGDITRFKILVALLQSELCVYDLTEILCMTKSAISHQLALLRSSKIVKSRRDGKNIYYSLDDDHIVRIISMAFDHIKE